MAVLLNQTGNLRLRLDLTGRRSDGVRAPASLSFEAALERYEHAREGGLEEHGFVPLVALAGAPLLDLDLIALLEQLEALLAAARGGGQGEAALAASASPALALRLAGGPEAFFVEAGLDLHAVLEPVGGQRSPPGEDLALFRFAAHQRAVLAFCAGLLDDFARFPTDPSRVDPGRAE